MPCSVSMNGPAPSCGTGVTIWQSGRLIIPGTDRCRKAAGIRHPGCDVAATRRAARGVRRDLPRRLDGRQTAATHAGMAARQRDRTARHAEDRALSVGRRHPQRRVLSRRIAGAGGEGACWASSTTSPPSPAAVISAPGWRRSCTAAARATVRCSAANKALTEAHRYGAAQPAQLHQLPDPRGRLRFVRHLVGDRAVAAQRAAELAGVRRRSCSPWRSCRCCTASCCGMSHRPGGMIALIAGYACLLGGTIMVCRSVPTHAYASARTRRPAATASPHPTVQRWIVAPMLAWAFLAPLWFSTVSAGPLRCRAIPVLDLRPDFARRLRRPHRGLWHRRTDARTQPLGRRSPGISDSGPSARHSVRSCCSSARHSASRCRRRRLPCSARSG